MGYIVQTINHLQSEDPLRREMAEANPDMRFSYKVVDEVTNKGVPFGSYPNREPAEARAAKENAK